MAEIKYQYAYDENGKLVSIDEYIRDTGKLHTFKCVGCGGTLLPRAIGSEYRRAHFYHKEVIGCSGETYIHKLAKKLIKEKFDNSDRFYIAYNVNKRCDKRDCRLRNIDCQSKYEKNVIDLKKYYDTCTEEAQVNGFIADLLLTNSKKPNTKPVLIEICVTHACEEEKRNSGLKIIEIPIQDERDVSSIINHSRLEESSNGYHHKNDIKFISFKRDIEVPMTSWISRYIFIPADHKNEILTKVKCSNADYKIRNDSLVELNIVNRELVEDFNILLAQAWIAKNKKLRRCNLCKFYYATMYESTQICRLSKKYGKPKYPKMNEAETCRSYHIKEFIKDYCDTTRSLVEEVTSSQNG